MILSNALEQGESSFHKRLCEEDCLYHVSLIVPAPSVAQNFKVHILKQIEEFDFQRNCEGELKRTIK